MAVSNEKSWQYLVSRYNQLVHPPARPCRQQLAFWQQLITRLPRQTNRALILGATPELRDLALRNNFFTFAIDISPAMLRGMTKLMHRANPRRERRIVADWRTVVLPQNHFDLVMADASLNNVLSAAGVRAVLRQVAGALAPAGMALMRTIVAPETARIKPITWWLRSVERGSGINPSDFSVIIRAASREAGLKSPAGRVDSVRVCRALLRHAAVTSRRQRPVIDFFYRALGQEHKYLLIYQHAAYERLLKQFFIIRRLPGCREHVSCRTVFVTHLLRK